jgi:hypothetical protein
MEFDDDPGELNLEVRAIRTLVGVTLGVDRV